MGRDRDSAPPLSWPYLTRLLPLRAQALAPSVEAWCRTWQHLSIGSHFLPQDGSLLATSSWMPPSNLLGLHMCLCLTSSLARAQPPPA